MKTITTKNISVYIFNDDRDVTIGADGTTVGADSSDVYKRKAYGISDMKSDNATLHTGVSETKSDVEYLKGTTVKVDDWVAHRYIYDGSTWTPNPTYSYVVWCQAIRQEPARKCNTQHGAMFILDSDGNPTFTLADLPTVCLKCEKNIDGT